MNVRLVAAFAGLASLLLLAGCGDDDGTAATAAAATATPVTSSGEATATRPAATAAASPTSAATPPAASASSSPPAAASPTAAVRRVNANTATEAEVAAALQAAGVSNAARWAKEVVEYRPYPANDPTMAKLRGELAKYNPGPGVVDAIVATLTVAP